MNHCVKFRDHEKRKNEFNDKANYYHLIIAMYKLTKYYIAYYISKIPIILSKSPSLTVTNNATKC